MPSTLLQTMPSGTVHSVISDAMYGVNKHCRYAWGVDPARGDPEKHWQYMSRYTGNACGFSSRAASSPRRRGQVRLPLPDWFGGYRIWTLTRLGSRNKTASGHIWVVQTQDQRPVPFPDKDSLVLYDRLGPLKTRHPCIKTVEEMVWMVKALTRPGQIVLDPFCGLGATLLASSSLDARSSAVTSAICTAR